MKFSNLRRTILAEFGEKWKQSGHQHQKEFPLESIRIKFQDIPNSNLENSIKSLHESGFILLSDNKKMAHLTQKGVNHLHFFNTEKNTEEIVVTKKIK